MSQVVLIGGSGFIGSAIAARLAERGHRIVVPTRRRERAKHLILLPGCDVLEADVHDDAQLARLVAGADAVINLVGILHGNGGAPYGSDWAKAHVALPRRIIAACKSAGVRRLLHMSALGADSGGPSMYLRSKGDGEKAVQASGLQWTIFRPSVVFGPGDRFLNLFARLQRLLPLLPLAGADCKFQPVHVDDVAQAFVAALVDAATAGRIYELAGPKVYTLRELVCLAGAAAGRVRPVIALPDGLARLQAFAMKLLPGEPLISADNIDSMKVDNIAGGTLPGLRELGIAPQSVEAALRDGLAPGGWRAHYNALRAVARR
jgi:NADH dehydrogenase